jgi:hypothetical protein
MRRGERQSGATRAAAHHAGAIVDPVKPIVEIQFCGSAIALRCVAGIAPVEGAPRLGAAGFAFQPWLAAAVFAGAEFTDRPA